MAYNLNTYMPYGQQGFPQAVTQPTWMYPPTQAVAQPFDNIVAVSGRKGAEAFQMGPNSRAILFDDKEDVMYRVTTDGAGVKTIAEFDFSPREQAHDAAPDVLAAMQEKLDELAEKVDALSAQKPAPRARKAAADGE